MIKSPAYKRFLRRSQSGQSIVILALGFIALLAFVGIVTDVSLLFVRYSTLRRAVDAAAIAAAGQMRRIVDSPTATEGEIQSASIANLNLAARSFIELYNLDPSSVLVETCYTQNVKLGGAGLDRPLDSADVPLYLYDVNGVVTGPNPAADEDTRRRYEELCTRDELKLVRVTAQLDSPTVFLRLLGFGTVTLQESAISQTAVIDVALMIDVSESMVYGTTFEDYEDAGYNARFLPPQLSNVSSQASVWNLYLERSQQQILTDFYGGAIPEFGTSTNPDVRQECQARFYPQSIYSRYVVNRNMIDTEYATVGWNDGVAPPHFRRTGSTPANYTYFSHGFVPSYDYYGCCNDPNGDGDFSDLVCQPFGIVRDAASNFLERLDFIRGDRVAFIVFDRSAHLIDPDGTGVQNAFIETLTDIDAPGTDSDRIGAQTILSESVGVRAEPSFYVDEGNNGTWDGFRTVSPDAPRVTVNIDGSPTQVGIVRFSDASNFYANTTTGRLFDSPVRESCFVDGAFNHHTYSLIDYYHRSDITYDPGEGSERSAGLFGNDPRGVPYVDNNPLDSTPLDQVANPPWLHSLTDLTNYERQRSYEYRAGCRGTNIASSLEEASSAFYRFGRREGAVWIMVLLSDGAAGASDPVRRQYPDGPDADLLPDERIADAPDLYANFQLVTNDETGVPHTEYRRAYPPYYPTDDFYVNPGYSVDPIPGDYGAYGLCPYGTASSTAAGSNAELLTDDVFPYCSDEQPQTRNICENAGEVAGDPVNPRLRLINVATIVGSTRLCEEIYDVDDYARDWADFIGLEFSSDNNTRLPTIFTIGFGLRYADTNDNPTVCGALPSGSTERAECSLRANNTSDYLGEELLRYIADVGDNNRLDSDYWQDVMDPAAQFPPFDPLDPGPRGPCETAGGVPGTWSPLSPKTSCGNYFVVTNTTDIDALESVFNTIASRLFTRLAQ